MKTQIVRLEPHDDFISARDKMGWNQAGRILLVYPEGGQILNRRLDLELLHRRSTTLGAQLSIVTNDPEVKNLARQVGIPVYSSIQKAQKSHWKADRRSGRKKTAQYPSGQPAPDLEEMRKAAHPETSKFLTNPGTRMAFFLIGVLALLSIAAVLVPSATIQLLPENKTQEINLDVKADPAVEAVNFSGLIPAQRITVIVEGRGSNDSSGNLRVPLEYAQGRVQFTNLTDQSIEIPANIIIRTIDEPAVRFATTRDAELAAGVGEKVIVSVVALEPGEAGNLRPNALSAIESDLGASMTATNPYQTWGGKDSILSLATPDNRKQLFKKIEGDLRQTALEELIRTVPTGDIVFSQTITISQVLIQDYEPEDDLPSEQVSLNLRIEYEAMSASKNDLERLAEYALDTSLPEMYISQPGTLQITSLTQPQVDAQGGAHWKIRAMRQIQSKILPSQAINHSLGLTPEQASQNIKKSLPIRGEPEIIVSPAWWPRLPVLPFRFDVSTP